jgi:branched-chain amino acid transport system permease protein
MMLTFAWFGYGFYIDRLEIWALGIAALLVTA